MHIFYFHTVFTNYFFCIIIYKDASIAKYYNQDFKNPLLESCLPSNKIEHSYSLIDYPDDNSYY